MSSDQAERWVVISALIVAGVYAYRRLTEVVADPPVGIGNIIGTGKPPPLGTFVTAWGVTFLGVSIIASVNAQLGGAFALLIATGDLLTNIPALTGDVAKHSQPAPAQTSPTVIAGNAITSTGSAVGSAISPFPVGMGDLTPSQQNALR